ncbi:hypothetical protein ACQJBY_066321 [Aegilops geniculata]
MAQEANRDGEPAMESAALVPGPPAATPPPWTDEGSLQLLEILRLHLRGVPHWFIPRYVVTGVNLYDREPEELLRAHPSAASADGKTAVYFLNRVRAKTKTDGRKCRMAPGGTWKSERAAVDIWGASRIAGTRQNLSFIIKGPEGEDLRSGYITQEFALAGDAGRLAGGDQLVLTKVYFTPRGEEAVSKAKERVIAKARRNKTAAAASSSSRAPLPPSPAPGKTPAPVAAASPAPPNKTPAPVASASPAAAKTPAPPKKMAALESSSPAPIDQAASTSSAGRPTPSTSLLLLEVGESPISQAQDYSIRHILRAAELVGSSLPLNKRKPVPFSCDGLFLLQEGPRKKFRSSP